MSYTTHSRLSSSRNSLIPAKQPLQQSQSQSQPTSATSFLPKQPNSVIGRSRTSAVFDKENAVPQQQSQQAQANNTAAGGVVVKKARLSIKPIGVKQESGASTTTTATSNPLPPTHTHSTTTRRISLAPNTNIIEANGIDTKSGYDVSLIGKLGEEETCFEEIRAKAGKYQWSAVQMKQENSTSSAAAATAVPKKPSLRESLALGPRSNARTPEHVQTYSSSSSSHPNNTSAAASPHHPSPTICTRSAMNDIDAMFKDASPLQHSFISRSLTTDIPAAVASNAMMDTNEFQLQQQQQQQSMRGRPSPVAFTVFTDEELMTRNIRQSDGGSLGLSNNGMNQMTDSFVNTKSYPPLTPIMELSHESDMSHASSNGGAPTPGGMMNMTSTQGQTSQIAAAFAVYQDETCTIRGGNTGMPEAEAAPSVASENTIDPYHIPQREAWVDELAVLSSSNNIIVSEDAAGFTLDDLANGSETSLELGDKLFQITSVLKDYTTTSNNDRTLLLQAENLLDGGEVTICITSRHNVLTHGFTSSFVQRILDATAVASGGDAAEVETTRSQLNKLFYLPQETYVYANHSILISSQNQHGSLRTLLQTYHSQNKQMDEKLIAFYTYELLKSIQFLHANQMLHNNLTLDSVMMRFDEDSNNGSTTTWSDPWLSSGENGWNQKGLILSNFLLSIDRTLFPAEIMFKCENNNTSAAAGSSSLPQAMNPIIPYAQDVLSYSSGWTEQIDLLSCINIVQGMLFYNQNIAGNAVDLLECALDESNQIQLVQSQSDRFLNNQFNFTTFLPFFETILNFKPSSQEAAHAESLDLLNLLIQHFEMALSIDVPVEGSTTGQTQPVAMQIKNLLCKQQMMMLQKK